MRFSDGLPSWRAGLLFAAAITVSHLLWRGAGAEANDYLIRDSLILGAATTVVFVVLPMVLRYLKASISSSATRARVHGTANITGVGRAKPSGPDAQEHQARLDGLSHEQPSTPPPRVSIWWFRFEGWQQATIIASLLSVPVLIALHFRFNDESLQRSDLFTALYVFSLILWAALVFWAGAYSRRAYPNLDRYGGSPGRNISLTIVAVLGAFEMFPQAVWFLVTLLAKALIAPFRAVLRRSNHRDGPIPTDATHRGTRK